MFQGKIDKIFKELLNVFGIADSILAVVYDDYMRDYENTLRKIPLICREVNFKLKKDKCHFRCSSVPFLEDHFQTLTETRS